MPASFSVSVLVGRGFAEGTGEDGGESFFSCPRRPAEFDSLAPLPLDAVGSSLTYTFCGKSRIPYQ